MIRRASETNVGFSAFCTTGFLNKSLPATLKACLISIKKYKFKKDKLSLMTMRIPP